MCALVWSFFKFNQKFQVARTQRLGSCVGLKTSYWNVGQDTTIPPSGNNSLHFSRVVAAPSPEARLPEASRKVVYLSHGHPTLSTSTRPQGTGP